uniref:Uncharacterized protein n=1 Tax=Siphoviridae sp. ct96x5 TaxID=2825367 RepID=A0A8S5PRS7_9CAUD|nr:MAG TPA: hypothetical protein [Siphoviridae sp. ct96x5]
MDNERLLSFYTSIALRPLTVNTWRGNNFTHLFDNARRDLYGY